MNTILCNNLYVDILSVLSDLDRGIHILSNSLNIRYCCKISFATTNRV